MNVNETPLTQLRQYRAKNAPLYAVGLFRPVDKPKGRNADIAEFTRVSPSDGIVADRRAQIPQLPDTDPQPAVPLIEAVHSLYEVNLRNPLNIRLEFDFYSFVADKYFDRAGIAYPGIDSIHDRFDNDSGPSETTQTEPGPEADADIDADTGDVTQQTPQWQDGDLSYDSSALAELLSFYQGRLAQYQNQWLVTNYQQLPDSLKTQVPRAFWERPTPAVADPLEHLPEFLCERLAGEIDDKSEQSEQSSLDSF